MNDLGRKIVQLRRTLGENQEEFAARFGVRQPTVSRWESGSMPEPLMLHAIADLAGVAVRDLLGAEFTIATHAGPRLMIKGAVAAGAWKEALEWPEEDWIAYTGGTHIDVPSDRRFGLVVEGESMNELYPPGTVLDCVSTIGMDGAPRNGQRVIVLRRMFSGSVEATVKEYRQLDDGREWLVPRSRNPSFQVPIEVGADDPTVEETRIIAIVRGAYLPE